MHGDFTKKVKVTTNDPQHRTEQLTCKGKVLVPFKASPRYANFREVFDETTPLPLTVTIKRGDGGPLDLEIVNANNPGIVADLKEIKAGEEYELLIGLDPPQKPGRLRAWVKIKTGIEQVPSTTIPVYATIPPGWAD